MYQENHLEESISGAGSPRESTKVLIPEARQLQRRRQRIIAAFVSAVVLIAGLVLATGFGKGAGSSSTKTKPANQPSGIALAASSCSIKNLSFSDGLQGAAGSYAGPLLIVNNGPTCALPKFTLRAYNAKSKQFLGPANSIYVSPVESVANVPSFHRSSGNKSLLVARLAKGKSTRALLTVVDTGTFTNNYCHVATATSIGVWLNNQPHAVKFFPFGVVDSKSPLSSFTVCTNLESVHATWGILN